MATNFKFLTETLRFKAVFSAGSLSSTGLSFLYDMDVSVGKCRLLFEVEQVLVFEQFDVELLELENSFVVYFSKILRPRLP